MATGVTHSAVVILSKRGKGAMFQKPFLLRGVRGHVGADCFLEPDRSDVCWVASIHELCAATPKVPGRISDSNRACATPKNIDHNGERYQNGQVDRLAMPLGIMDGRGSWRNRTARRSRGRERGIRLSESATFAAFTPAKIPVLRHRGSGNSPKRGIEIPSRELNAHFGGQARIQKLPTIQTRTKS